MTTDAESEKKKEETKSTSIKPFVELKNDDIVKVLLEDGRHFVCKIRLITAGFRTWSGSYDGQQYTTWKPRFTVSLYIGGVFKSGITSTRELGEFESISYKEGSIVPDAKTLTWADLQFDLWKNVPKSIDWNPEAVLDNVKSTYNNYQKVKSVEYASAPSAPARIATSGSTGVV